MKYKKLTFLEAAKYLADKANIPLQIEGQENDKISRQKELLYKINVEAARYYFANLQKDKIAKEYFLKRGIKEETIKRFGLGYSHDTWQGVINFLRTKGYKNDLLYEAGLVSKNEKTGNIYDR